MNLRTCCAAVCAGLLLSAGAAGLAATGQPPVVPPIPAEPPAAPPASEEYVLRPGDVVDAKFFYNPDLNETLLVRPDGRVSLQLVGEVPAGGRTPAELRADLMTRYASVLRQPEVAIIVKQIAPRRLYVGGEVRTPSLLRVDAPVTALQAIFEAGGFTRASKATDVVILRYHGTPQPEFIKVNLEPALRTGDKNSDVPLQPLDILWVPKTKIAKAGDFMDQYFRQLVPVPMTLGISYVFGTLVP